MKDIRQLRSPKRVHNQPISFSLKSRKCMQKYCEIKQISCCLWNTSGSGSVRKFWKAIYMSKILIVMMVSQLYKQRIKLYTLNMYSLLYIKYILITLFFFSKVMLHKNVVFSLKHFESLS